jgi:UTP--glucose-1-phosphate uridylyltransferase
VFDALSSRRVVSRQPRTRSGIGTFFAALVAPLRPLAADIEHRTGDSMPLASTAATRVRKAVLPVAGRGTRLLPATRAVPKELLPIVDRPLIEFAVEEALAAGIDQIIFVTAKNKNAIEDHFDGWTSAGGARPAFATVRQASPRGLGDAILRTEELVGNEPFAVLLPDDLVVEPQSGIATLTALYDDKRISMLAVEPISAAQTSSYGVIAPFRSFDRRHMVEDIIEKPGPDKAPSLLGVVGRYVFTPSIFRHLHSTAPGYGGEVQLTDAIRAMLDDEELWAVELPAKRIDCGTRAGFLRAQLEVAAGDPELARVVDEWRRSRARLLPRPAAASLATVAPLPVRPSAWTSATSIGSRFGED